VSCICKFENLVVVGRVVEPIVETGGAFRHVQIIRLSDKFCEARREVGMAQSALLNTRLDRIKGALYGLLIADAIAMPTHWFYGGPGQIRGLYGSPIKGYVAPVDRLPGSIMNKSNTGGAGRGSDQGKIIGDVINHGKRKFWKRGQDYHYHVGLKAGDNTLEASLERNVLKILATSRGHFDIEALRSGYVKFMTTKGSHNDTYASTCHRMFFKNMTEGQAPKNCPDNDRHNVDTTDAITMTIPVALLAATDAEASKQVSAMVATTRKSAVAQQLGGVFSMLLRTVVNGTSARDMAVAGGRIMRYDVASDVARSRADPITA